MRPATEGKMATAQMDTVIRHLRRAVLRQDGAGWTDGQLLASFIDQQDETAFEVLVRRHGPMVFGVCRRVVGKHHDAEDAFQATFLVLARKASSVRPREKVANWLHGVAFRTAMKAKVMTAKRRVREKQVTEMPEPTAVQQDQWRDLQPLLDQELNGLPENYRLPILLCDLAGKTIKEATQQLGWPQGTLAGRLARGRKMLAKRLAGQGVVLSAGSLATVLSQNMASAAVPASLMSATAKTASIVAAGQMAVAGVVAVNVSTLMEGVMKAMLITKLKTITAALLVVAAVGIGGTLLCRSTTAAAQTARVGDGTGQSETKGSEPEYKSIFIRTLGVMAGHFEQITYANQYDGRIEASTQGAHATGMIRQGYVSLSCQEGKCFLNVRVIKLRTTGDKSEVVGRDAELERMILTKLNAQPIQAAMERRRFRGAGAEVSVNSDAGLTGSVVVNERNFDIGLRVGVNPGVAPAGMHVVPFVDSGTVGSPPVPAKTKPVAPRTEAPKGDLDRFQGVWSAVSSASGGRKLSKLDKAVFFMVDGKRACWQTSDWEAQGGLYLDPTNKPRAYDFVTSTRTIEGIYSLEGDTLRLCYDMATEPKRPAGFITEKGSRQVLMVLKRIHGPEVFPFRLPDGTRAFPSLIDRPTTPPPPPLLVPQPEASKTTPHSETKRTAKIGRIIVVGNTRTETSVILKMIPINPGDVLDYEALRTAAKNLAAFNPTITVEESGDNPDFTDVRVTVKEKRPISRGER
jgi:RNA polymerase sigma factor (sigma-70 family)